MKLLDFTGRKVDPSLLLGDMKTKKEKDPNIKVGRFLIELLHNPDLTVYQAGVPSIQTLRLCGASHTQEEEEGHKTKIR